MKMEFVSKRPHSSRSLVVLFLDSEPIQPLIKSLQTIDWKPFSRPFSVGEGTNEISFVKEGTGPFGSWTSTEEKSFLKEVKKMLDKEGHKNIPYRKLTFMELI